MTSSGHNMIKNYLIFFKWKEKSQSSWQYKCTSIVNSIEERNVKLLKLNKNY